MDFESLGTGGIGGVIIGILTAFGINYRVKRIEENKQDKTVCSALHKSSDDKFEILIKGQEKIFNRLDNLNDYLRNNK